MRLFHWGQYGVLLAGGEPLLRKDFFDIYVYLRRKGFVVSIFTNATLITDKHIKIFKKYAPKYVEITVYGVTEKTYESITRIPGSFIAFTKGLNLLLKNRIRVRLKTMVLRSNVHEFSEIARFCREKSKGYFRFDPFIQLRLDRNIQRNKEILSERLSPEEIVDVEKSDFQRSQVLLEKCSKYAGSGIQDTNYNRIFSCAAGMHSFSISYDGYLRLCLSLCHPACTFDVRKNNIEDIWNVGIPRVLNMRSDSKEFKEKCCLCPIFDFCMWCPVCAYLETGYLDKPVKYFCDVAHARVKAFTKV